MNFMVAMAIALSAFASITSVACCISIKADMTEIEREIRDARESNGR